VRASSAAAGRRSKAVSAPPAHQHPAAQAGLGQPEKVGAEPGVAGASPGGGSPELNPRGLAQKQRRHDGDPGRGHQVEGGGERAATLSYSPDGKAMAWGCNDGALKVAAGREKANLADRRPTSVAFSPEGKTLASTHQDGTVRARDLGMKGEIPGRLGKEWILQQHPSRVFSVTYSGDGKTLAWGCDDGSLRVWDAAAGKETGNFKERRVSVVRLSPDGKVLAASGDWGESVKLLDPATGKELAVLKAERDLVTCLAFNPDGKTLASGGNKGAILWDVATGQKLADLPGNHGVSSLAFSPDGKTLASGGSDKLIRLWDVPAR
jgi:WD40 repeat protein